MDTPPERDISVFQKLYYKHYGKKVSKDRARHIRHCLITLLRICRDVANRENEK